MLPTGHIEFTWAALNLLQRKAGLFQDADYRLVALAALAPDLLDKPLALTIYRDTDAALFWGHNLWFHLAVWLVVLGWSRWFSTKRSTLSGGSHRCAARSRRGCGAARAKLPPSAPLFSGQGVMPYLLAFSGHLLADRMWGFQESLFYPLGAGHWHTWVHVGAPGAMLAAYLEIIRTTPILVAFEVIGLALLAWFVWDRGLWRRGRLAAWLRTGWFTAAGQVPPFRNRGFSRSSGRGNNRLKPRVQKL